MSQTLQKIILLINLLHNRDYVTMHEANALCGIHERSFYRYVNALSEIDIPIVYDKNVKGYRLTNKIVKRRIDFNAYEITLITLSLHLFAQQMNKNYAKDIESLIKKVITLVNFPLEYMFERTSLTGTNMDEKKALSYFVNYTLLEIASSNELGIEIDYRNGGGKSNTGMTKPRIIFNHDWYVEDKIQLNRVLISTIEHISIKT